jgi:glycosyltransferase involved in cell wall biosynthesis
MSHPGQEEIPVEDIRQGTPLPRNRPSEPPQIEPSIASRLRRAAILEYLEYDASLLRRAVALGGAGAAALLWIARQRARAFNLVSRIHRSGGSDAVSAVIQRGLARLHRLERGGRQTGLWRFYEAYTRESVNLPEAAGIVKQPDTLFGYRVLVLKAASPQERGVIVLDYSYVFPLFAALYDVEAIAQRYHIVLEPSWRGLCTADILGYSRFDFPVFVQTIEPRDVAFIQSLQSNLRTVPIAANWWVDHRLARPLADAEREIDVIMVAAWSDIKRHWRFFKVLADLRERGYRLSVALVGYRADKSRDAVEAEARYFGVFDQISIHEKLSLQDVGGLLARSRVHVLWSRKEGANRAVVEALFADVPIVVREGLSYGHPYPYVNPETGRFANEETLGETLLEILSDSHRFRPRAWAMAHMSCQRATDILERTIREHALASGEPWTRGLVVKTVHLDSQRYWNPSDAARFEADYAFLKGQERKNLTSRPKLSS